MDWKDSSVSAQMSSQGWELKFGSTKEADINNFKMAPIYKLRCIVAGYRARSLLEIQTLYLLNEVRLEISFDTNAKNKSNINGFVSLIP